LGCPTQAGRGLTRGSRQQRCPHFFGFNAEYFEEYVNMPLLNIVIALIIVGLGLWLINRFIPMAGSIKTILNVVVVVAVCVWVLQVTGLWGPLSSYKVSR
jgi:hypothetical protein